MYGLRAVRGVIDVRCPELRGVPLAASEVCNSLAERYFQSVNFFCPRISKITKPPVNPTVQRELQRAVLEAS